MKGDSWTWIVVVGALFALGIAVVRRAATQSSRPPSALPNIPDPAPSAPGAGSMITSGVFVIMSALTILGGWWRMYSYDEFGGDKIVGADAYNYTILATRGVGIIGAGVGFGIIATVFALYAIAERVKAH